MLLAYTCRYKYINYIQAYHHILVYSLKYTGKYDHSYPGFGDSRTHNRTNSFENFPPHLHHKISRMKNKFSGFPGFNLF